MGNGVVVVDAVGSSVGRVVGLSVVSGVIVVSLFGDGSLPCTTFNELEAASAQTSPFCKSMAS
jgi:hypothetical protein